MKNRLLICLLALISANVGYSQLNVGTGQLFIQSGAIVSVQGDVTSSTDILGPGKILLNGTANQNVNMSGFSIPNLEVNNTANVTLTGNAKIGSSLLFTNGKIVLGTNNLELADVATTSGGGVNNFAETNGTGKLLKDITTNLTNYVMPVGNAALYSPVQLTTTGANTGAIISVQSKPTTDPNKNIRSSDYLNRYWTVTQTGVNGTLNAKGQYNDPTDITGSEALLNGIYWNGTSWSLAGSSLDPAANLAGANITGAGGDLYAMNKFVLSKVKVFLQAPAFSANLMDDKLRNSSGPSYTPGTLPASNLLPLSDPYRTAPYSTTFTHVNNTTPEVIASSVLNDQADPTLNVVDWVFVELRTAVTPGNTVLDTRAALLLRNGTIVDVDGVSPLYFKDVAAGNYTVAVRHRNHLGLSTNPATFTMAMDLPTPAATLDMTTLAAGSLMGTAGTNYFNNGTFNFLYGGNANSNTNTRFNGLNNDKDFLLTNATYGLNGNPAGLISNVYSPSDLNMNRNVRFNGLANDKDFILITVLGSDPAGLKTQALPN